jgi:hypothetical protein
MCENKAFLSDEAKISVFLNPGLFMKCDLSKFKDFKEDASEVRISNLASCIFFCVGVRVPKIRDELVILNLDQNIINYSLKISLWITSGISHHNVRDGP